jgi:hypothetical protein
MDSHLMQAHVSKQSSLFLTFEKEEKTAIVDRFLFAFHSIPHRDLS